MIEKKMFIQNRHYDNVSQRIILTRFAEEIGVKLIIDYSSEEDLREIPDGYEFYLLHLEDIEDSNEISRLKREQPWSYIIGFSGAVHYTTTYDVRTDFEDKKEYCDKILGSSLDLTEEVKRIIEERSKKC
jgi:hypothetical protein